VTEHSQGSSTVMAIANLAMVTGNVGRRGVGVNPLRGQNNVQGACDMGCLPNVYPGYQDAADAAVQAKFATAWGRPAPEHPGLTSLGMTQAALDGALRALMIMGEEPVLTDPNQGHVARALAALDFLVVVELSLTETAKLADVVLPAASFAEKHGTFTNCERRVQRVRQAIAPPGEARCDWQILGELAARLGYPGMAWSDAEAVFDEMAGLTPIYSAMSYPALDRQHGLQWPCDGEHPQGSPLLHWPGLSYRSRAAAAGDPGRTRRVPGRRLPVRLYHPSSALPLRWWLDDPPVAAARTRDAGRAAVYAPRRRRQAGPARPAGGGGAFAPRSPGNPRAPITDCP